VTRDDALAEAQNLLEDALFLHINGERPPGAPPNPQAETWADWDRRCKALLRSLSRSPAVPDATVLCSVVVWPNATGIAIQEEYRIVIEIKSDPLSGEVFHPDDAVTLDLVRR